MDPRRNFIKFLFLITLSNGLDMVNPVVNTSLGVIRGSVATDGDYFMFLGIPYARVNKTNPFGISIPFPKFPNGLQASIKNQAICPQSSKVGQVLVGVMDCLNLNIYVPRSCNISEDNRFPILVHIHGDNYVTGSNEVHIFGPKYLVRHNIIVVNISYRLGPYGFLCLDTAEVPGNQGFKDQVTALRWIHKHIHHFGGDPNLITISGHGSGSQSVDLHLHSPQELLYQQAILEAGNDYVPDLNKSVNRSIPIHLAEELGFKAEYLNDALTFLTSADPLQLISASIRLDIQYGPCVEKHFDNVERFCTDSFDNDVPKVQNVTIIIGQTDDEMASIFNKRLQISEAMFSSKLGQCFAFDCIRMNEMEDIVHRFYIGDTPVSEGSNTVQVKNFVSDISINHPNRRLIKKYLKNGAAKIFYSIFKYNGDRNIMKILDRFNAKESGAIHGDELGYLFTNYNLLKSSPSLEDQRMIDKMTSLWGNFVKYGNPTPSKSELLPVKWVPVSNSSLHCYVIDKEVKMDTEPFAGRMQFWDLFYALNWEYQRGLVGDNKM